MLIRISVVIDLFFRINVFPIHLPPLRKRSEDIPLLVNTFVRRLRLRTGKKINGLSSAAMDCFMNYRWPGNVRELKSALEYAFVIAEKGLIDRDQLPSNIVEPKPLIPESVQVSLQANGFPKVDEFMISEPNSDEPGEKTALIKALQQCKGNQSQTARVLGINRVTVWNRMKKYGIDLKRVLSI